jgi:glyoxylase-like metal-dependent hydrolase (beta-lactamase superfamily II)
MSYLLDGAYLFTGDTCKFSDGTAYAGSRYTLDIDTQKQSLRKLAQLDRRPVCVHCTQRFYRRF